MKQSNISLWTHKPGEVGPFTSEWIENRFGPPGCPPDRPIPKYLEEREEVDIPTSETGGGRWVNPKRGRTRSG